MEKKKTKVKPQARRKLSRRSIALIILLIVVLVASGLIAYRVISLKEAVLNETTVKTLSENPTCAISINSNIAIGNSQGYVAVFDSSGNSQFLKKIDSKIFGLVLNPNDNSLVVAGVSYHFLDKNFKELFKVSFTNFIPKEPFVGFLSNGQIKLVFQSVKDLSYQIVTIDKTGKVLTKDTIPDMQQNSSLSISPSGLVVLFLESGEVYLLNGSRIQAKVSLDAKSGAYINGAFTLFVKDNIIVGYRNLVKDPNVKEIQTLPVYFYNSSLTQVGKYDLDSSINSVYASQNEVVISAEGGFYFFDTTGKLLSTLTSTDSSPYFYSETSKAQLFVYKTSNEKSSPYFQTVLKDQNGKEIGRFIRAFAIDNPMFILSNDSYEVFIIEGTSIKVIKK